MTYGAYHGDDPNIEKVEHSEERVEAVALLPCPFCGAAIESVEAKRDVHWLMHVGPSDECILGGGLWSSVADWNTRAALSALPVGGDGEVTISREAFDFLMGEGPLEGVWFGDLHDGLPGAFWWRGLLLAAAGWPERAALQHSVPSKEVK